MLDPDRVKFALPRIFVGALVEECGTATGFFAQLVRTNRGSNKRFQVAEDLADAAGANCARHIRRCLTDFERHILQVVDKLLTPYLCIARTSTLQQNHD